MPDTAARPTGEHERAPEGQVYGAFVRDTDADVLLGLADTLAAARTIAAEDDPARTLFWRPGRGGGVITCADGEYCFHSIRLIPIRRDRSGTPAP